MGLDEHGIDTLYREQSRAVLAYLLRRVPDPEDAADLLAEVFTTAWRRRADVPDGGQARLWLFGVARATLANHRRSHRRRSAATSALAESLHRSQPHHGDSAHGSTERVHQALALLPHHDREILTLVAWEDLSPSEAAAVIGVPASSARTRLQRARARLRRLLDVDPGDVPPQRTVGAAIVTTPPSG